MASERRRTVLHLLNASDAGGLSRYIIDVGRAVQCRGWRVAVAGDRGAWHDRFLESGLEYVEVPLMRGIGGFLQSVKILRQWRDANGGIELIHSHYRRATQLGRKLQQPRRRPPILYTLHLSHLDLRGWRRWLSDFGDHTHVASEDARRWMLDSARVKENKITLVPHGIDIDRWPVTTDADRAAARGELGLGDDDIVALFVGRLDEQKQPGWIIDAADALAPTHPRVRWLLVGDGPDRGALASRPTTHQPRITFLGERDPLTPYRAADLLLSTSWREGFSYVAAEAMATGLPVLRTRTSGTHETIVEGVTGRSVPIDKAAFIAAAGEMLADHAKLAAMRPACAAHARRDFRFEQQIDRTLALYDAIATLGRPTQ